MTNRSDLKKKKWKKLKVMDNVQTNSHKSKCKVYPVTVHEGSEGSKYNCALSLTLALDGVGGQHLTHHC